MSSLDYVSTVLPHVSLLLNLRTLKKYLAERPGGGMPPRREETQTQKPNVTTAQRKSTRCLQLLNCCWGLGVVGIHVLAQRRVYVVPGCRLENSPWFVTKAACAVIDLNCFHLNTTGSALILDDQLARVDEDSLSVLGISNCPDLRMPSRIRTFPNLYGIVVFNATITDWDDPTALHRDALARFNYLLFVRVNFSAAGDLPTAVTQPTLPPTLQDIEFAVSNLRALPDGVDALWPHVVSLYVEFTALTAVPRTVFQLPRLESLSLVGNAIPALPDDALDTTSSLRYLTLSRTPLVGLPLRASNQSLWVLREIDVEYTGITHLPDWAWRWLDAPETAMKAFGSPLCDAAAAASGVTRGDTGARPPGVVVASSRSVEICGADAGTRTGLVPASVVTSHHAVS